MSGDLRGWFRWVAWAEGLSVVMLFAVAMPAKRLLGATDLMAWSGWLHGVFFLQYLTVLLALSREQGWGIGKLLMGAIAGVLPLGSFWFERRI